MRMLLNREARYFIVLLLMLGLSWTTFSPVSQAYSQDNDILKLELGDHTGIQATAWIKEKGQLSKHRNTYDIIVDFHSSDDGRLLHSGRAVVRYGSMQDKETTILTLRASNEQFTGGPMVVEKGTQQRLEIICVLADGLQRNYATQFTLN